LISDKDIRKGFYVMTKAIITVLGSDRMGIIAKVSAYLAEKNINILDKSQTIMDNVFTMITMVDISASTSSFDVIHNDLQTLGQELGVKIQIQNTEIFNSMHKI
jgi:ACT domain-containing protein